jgi:hypothetical protein
VVLPLNLDPLLSITAGGLPPLLTSFTGLLERTGCPPSSTQFFWDGPPSSPPCPPLEPDGLECFRHHDPALILKR